MIGTGGLGSPLGLYLTAAGVGTIGLVDFDVVDESNLQRQIIHGTKDVGRPKIESAKDRLLDINPNTNIEAFETRLTSENALELFKDFDVIVDGTDNFPTRYLVNDASVLTGKPNVYGSIFRFEGQVERFLGGKRRVLPLSLSRTAAAGTCSVVRRRRRSRRFAGNRRHDSGERSYKSYPGRRRNFIKSSFAFRCVENEIPRIET